MNVKESPVKTDVGGNPVSKDVSGREVSSDSEETTVQKIPKKSQQIKTDKPRPHACSICTRAFARLEHLKRHERSHTNEKPFQCATCGRCFARRDLVLRHQQKLHFISSSNLRRNSAKEGEQSEHINILRNNTDANAPLPDMNDDIKDFNSSTHSHENSPDKIGMRINAHHPMRDSLFSHQPSFASSGSSIIPSPMPTHSNNNTPPTGVHSGPAIGDLHSYQNPSPRTASNGSPNKSVMSKQLGSDISVDVPKLPSANNGIAPQQFRHSSFSAASGMSYTNLKDSLDIQQNNVVFETPSQVDFATPQQVPHDRNYYGGVDLTSLDIDWNNIDSLDLGSSFLPKSKKSSATNLAMNFPEITSKQRSNRNLQQYFDLNVIATHQFQNPSHPHHIKGTTPLEFGVNPPFDPEVQNSVNGQIGPNQIHLNEDAIEHKAIRRALRENSEVAKRIKLEKTVEQEDWLKDIVSSTTSHESSAPTSNQSNFSGFYIDDGSLQTQIDDTHATLKPKQSVNDKDNKGSKFKPHMSDQNNVLDIFTFNPTNISRKEIFLVDIRDKICKASGIKNEEFHSAEKLNEYAIVYEKTFNKHFPFIHIPSLKNSRDIEKKVPLILSIAAVGAFCSFERDNAKQLFDVSKLFIKNYLQKELSAERAVLKSAQIDVHQCLVLHVIISLLLNDQGMFDITAKQLKSTVAFMVSTKLHLRTSATIPPPPSMMNKDTDSMRKNYAFFIESQSRIRTIHILHTIEVFRSFFLGSGMTLPFTAIDNGGPSPFETLWSAEDFDSWRKLLEELNFDFNLPIETISNGNFPRDLISSLKGWKTPPSYGFTDTLSSLFYIHERLLDEISKYNNKAFSTSEWRIKSRPKLDNLIHSWEQSYTQLGGILRINEFNKEVIKSNKIFRSIISLHALAKIRSILNISPFLQKAVSQDWNGMRAELKKLSKDEVELREGIDFALETIKLWVLDISATRDSKYRSLDTPFLFLTCLFVSILIIFSYLDAVELGRISVTAFDKQKWLQCRELLLNADSLLAHNKEENQMAKTLKQDNERPLDVGDVGSFLSANNSDTWITQYFKSYKLSSKCLYIGIRILADAPVWPLSVSFAEAIKNVSSDAA